LSRNITRFDAFMFMTHTVELSGKVYFKILCCNLSCDSDMCIVTSVRVCVCVCTHNKLSDMRSFVLVSFIVLLIFWNILWISIWRILLQLSLYTVVQWLPFCHLFVI